MSGRKSVGALASVTIVAMTASVLLAFVTIDPPPLPVKQKKTHAVATPTPAIAVTPVTTAPAPPPAKVSAATQAGKPTDWQTIAMDELRARANKNEIPAMEELGRRLLQGLDMPKDPQAGAGWLLRAAGLGSVQSAFNIGVMYERGFVVERDSSKAAEWYRKAADAGLPTAKHNLALLLRDGKGTARDVKAATQLLLSAPARQCSLRASQVAGVCVAPCQRDPSASRLRCSLGRRGGRPNPLGQLLHHFGLSLGDPLT